MNISGSTIVIVSFLVTLFWYCMYLASLMHRVLVKQSRTMDLYQRVEQRIELLLDELEETRKRLPQSDDMEQPRRVVSRR